MEQILSILIGIGLSATCGFRIFVPLLGMSIAHHAGALEFASGFDWIGAWPATIAFGIAMGLEIAAYYIPWLDNLLDTIATPAAIIAGTIATASMVGDVTPFFRWSLAIFLLTEMVLLVLIRDSLLLNVVMLLWPSDALKAWQAGN